MGTQAAVSPAEMAPAKRTNRATFLSNEKVTTGPQYKMNACEDKRSG